MIYYRTWWADKKHLEYNKILFVRGHVADGKLVIILADWNQIDVIIIGIASKNIKYGKLNGKSNYIWTNGRKTYKK
jgi:hypothetical protein